PNKNDKAAAGQHATPPDIFENELPCDELARLNGARRIEEGRCCSPFSYPPPLEHDDVLGQPPRFPDVMRSHHYLDTLPTDCRDELLDCFCACGVETCCRLIQKQYRGITSEAACQS